MLCNLYMCVWRCYSWTACARWLRMRYDITMVHVTIFLPLDHISKNCIWTDWHPCTGMHLFTAHMHILYAVCRLKLAPITITRADNKFKNQFKYFIICFSSVIHSIDRSIDWSFVRSFACSDGRPISSQFKLLFIGALSAAFINCVCMLALIILLLKSTLIHSLAQHHSTTRLLLKLEHRNRRDDK